MSATQFENKVTMGNILTALAMLVAVVAAYSNLQARQDQLDKQASATALRVETNERRLSALEQANATTAARYESLSQAVAEVKVAMTTNNDLLRQLVLRSAK